MRRIGNRNTDRAIASFAHRGQGWARRCEHSPHPSYLPQHSAPESARPDPLVARASRSIEERVSVCAMAPPKQQDIHDRFTDNIARVRSLVARYNDLVGPGPGRPPVEVADILRASVILLHAALEDLLRSMEELRLPRAHPEAFIGLRLAPHGSSREAKEKFSLVELAAYRGQSVDEVIEKAILLHLERSNYNNIGEVKQALQRAGVQHNFSPAESATIEAMMRRRHWIAHRADRNPSSGRGHPTVQPLGRGLVEQWISLIDTFGRAVVAAL